MPTLAGICCARSESECRAYHLVGAVFLVGDAVEVDVRDGPRVAVDDAKVDGLGAIQVDPLLLERVVVDHEVGVALQDEFNLFYHLVYNSNVILCARPGLALTFLGRGLESREVLMQPDDGEVVSELVLQLFLRHSLLSYLYILKTLTACPDYIYNSPILTISTFNTL
jgi:hypothetical protein